MSDDREREIKERMRVLGVGRAEAEFITAIERDEIDGDVVVLDEKGNEVRGAANG